MARATVVVTRGAPACRDDTRRPRGARDDRATTTS
jgi:hypothetical protein